MPIRTLTTGTAFHVRT